MEGKYSQPEADTTKGRVKRQKEVRSLVTLFKYRMKLCNWPYLWMVLLHEPINSLYCLSWVELGFCYLEPTAGYKGLGLEGPELLILSVSG